jgi:hypothetical protein
MQVQRQIVNIPVSLQTLKTLRHRPVIYIGEIGQINHYQEQIIPRHKSHIEIFEEFPSLPLYKYGVSTDVCRRFSKEHVKTFHYFDVKFIQESFRHQEVEHIIKQELILKNRIVHLVLAKKVQREIMFLLDDKEKQWFLDLIQDVITEKCRQTYFAKMILL